MQTETTNEIREGVNNEWKNSRKELRKQWRGKQKKFRRDLYELEPDETMEVMEKYLIATFIAIRGIGPIDNKSEEAKTIRIVFFLEVLKRLREVLAGILDRIYTNQMKHIQEYIEYNLEERGEIDEKIQEECETGSKLFVGMELLKSYQYYEIKLQTGEIPKWFGDEVETVFVCREKILN